MPRVLAPDVAQQHVEVPAQLGIAVGGARERRPDTRRARIHLEHGLCRERRRLVAVGHREQGLAGRDLEHIAFALDAERPDLHRRPDQRPLRPVLLHGLDGDSRSRGDLREGRAGVAEFTEEIGRGIDDAPPGLLRLAEPQLGSIDARYEFQCRTY